MLPILLLLHAILLFVARPRRHPALRRWLATLGRLRYTALYLCSIFIGVIVSFTLTWLALDFAETAWFKFALTGDCRYQRMHPDCVRQSRLMQTAIPPMPSTLMHASPTTRPRAPLLPDSSVFSAPHKDKDTGLDRQILDGRKNATGGSLTDLD